MHPSRVLALLGALLLASSALGFVLADAWYHDDACTIEAWKCQLGGLGLAAMFYGLPIGIVLVIAAALIAWLDPGGATLLATGSFVALVLGVGLVARALSLSSGDAAYGELVGVGGVMLAIAFIGGIAVRPVRDRQIRAANSEGLDPPEGPEAE